MFFVLVWVFVYVFVVRCLFVCWGCLFYRCLGCFLFGVLVLGGHAKTFLFEKLHAQFAVLQIARTRA